MKASDTVRLIRPLNPYHKTSTIGGDELSWNEQPEFRVWEEGRKAGIKEVVEFVENHSYDWEIEPHLTITRQEWQIQKKKWGSI